ncbi:hypothetical protein [Bacillus sp. B15-48]|uniref:hypothetical protein n=1 Tax=Bacillus sp. B15-48 TaxID=1548601 RepID=UPI00193F0522|nr:hypothetical protein [Bacillus sp. B15-48]MBM4764463.1 hypothetical protein [Bacillus sp. B15-48]
MVINKQSTLTLYPLTIRKDTKNYIVEDIRSSEFYEMPKLCIEAISMINEGHALDTIEEILKKSYPNEEVDMIGFVEDLLEFGLVYSIDGKIVSKDVEKRIQSNGFVSISPKIGQFFFNRYSSIIYLLTFIATVLTFIINPELFPSYKDVFLFDLMMYNIIVFLILTFLLVILHEIGHVLAVRAEGLPTSIEIGHRLFLVVLETDMSRVWSIPPVRRYRFYLAGMYVDIVVLFVALLIQIMFSSQMIVVGIGKMAVLSTFIRILYQFCVHMKTDLYYVLENWTGCYNLMENGQNFLRRWLPFIPDVNTSKAFDGEDKVIRPYAILYLIGILITFAVLIFYSIPLVIHASILVSPGLSEPLSSILFWDAIVFFLQFVIIFGLLGYSWSKKYRLNH